MHLLTAMLPQLLLAIGFGVIGAVLAPKAGPGRSRMWAGLVVLIAGAVVGMLHQLIFQIAPMFYARIGTMGFGVVSLLGSVVSLALSLVGVGLLAHAVTIGRVSAAQLDPNNPGAPPTYPQSTDRSGIYPSSNDGGNPYV